MTAKPKAREKRAGAHRHNWEIHQPVAHDGVKRAGDWSWCRCGTLRWRRLDDGPWETFKPGTKETI